MKITVTTNVTVQHDDGDVTKVRETTVENAGGNPRFEARELARVILVTNEKVLDRFGGQEAVMRKPVNESPNPTTRLIDRMYGPFAGPTDPPRRQVALQDNGRPREAVLDMLRGWVLAAEQNRNLPGQVTVFGGGIKAAIRVIEEADR